MISTHWAFGMAFSWYIHVHVVGTKRNDKLNVWSQSQFRNNDGNDNIEQYSRYKKICSLTTAKRCRRAKFLTPICIISFLPRCLFIFVFPSSDGGPEIKNQKGKAAFHHLFHPASYRVGNRSGQPGGHPGRGKTCPAGA